MVEDYTPYYCFALFLFAGACGIWTAIDAIRRERDAVFYGVMGWTVIGLVFWFFIRPPLRERYLEVSEEEYQEALKRAAE